METKGSYEHVDHPSHYKDDEDSLEAIDIIERVYGVKATMLWCEITAFKYRLRMGKKPNEPIERDLSKENWYLNKKKELKNRL